MVGLAAGLCQSWIIDPGPVRGRLNVDPQGFLPVEKTGQKPLQAFTGNSFLGIG